MFRKKKIYRNFESLEPINNVFNEVDEALKNKHRTIKTSSMPEILGALAGGGVGVGAGLTLIYVAGSVTGVSAAGISSGLAALGGSMLGGVIVAGAIIPATAGFIGYKWINRHNKKKLEEDKQRFLQEALTRQEAINRELKPSAYVSIERTEYLNSLNILLMQIIKDLQSDLSGRKWFR